MLVLSRDINQRVNIYGPDGEKIGTVSLAGVRGSSGAKIGFEFPVEFRIVREEVETRDAGGEVGTVRSRKDVTTDG